MYANDYPPQLLQPQMCVHRLDAQIVFLWSVHRYVFICWTMKHMPLVGRKAAYMILSKYVVLLQQDLCNYVTNSSV